MTFVGVEFVLSVGWNEGKNTLACQSAYLCTGYGLHSYGKEWLAGTKTWRDFFSTTIGKHTIVKIQIQQRHTRSQANP